MDFNKLVNTLKSIDPTNVFDPNGASKKALTESAAPAQKVQLSEEAQMRVLAGVSTIVAESQLVMEKAKSVAQQQAAGAALAAKRGEGKAKGASKEMMKMSTKELEKFAGTKHKGLPKKKADESVEALDTDEEIAEVFDADAKVGDKKKTAKGVATKTATGLKHERSYEKEADDEDDKPAKKSKKANEGFDADAKVGDKFDTKTGVATKTKTGVKHERTKYDDSEEKKTEKKKVKEAAKPDFLDVDKDGDKKEPMKKAAADKKKGAVADKKTESKMMPKGKKRPVKESVEQRLSFKDCIRLVRESGGQQQIDPVDKVLWQWVERVAASKYPMEGVQRDAFAGVTYERFGGRFELYDILSETKK